MPQQVFACPDPLGYSCAGSALMSESGCHRLYSRLCSRTFQQPGDNLVPTGDTSYTRSTEFVRSVSRLRLPPTSNAPPRHKCRYWSLYNSFTPLRFNRHCGADPTQGCRVLTCMSVQMLRSLNNIGRILARFVRTDTVALCIQCSSCTTQRHCCSSARPLTSVVPHHHGPSPADFRW